MPPTVLVVQHSDDDPPGRLGGWLTAAGCRLQVVRPDRGEPLPAGLGGCAGLVVLGGVMTAYDDERAPWLPGTRRLLRSAVDDQVAALGVCLGHQLLAVAAGGRVDRAPAPQRGVRPVRPSADAGTDRLFGPLPAGASAVHWNEDVVVDLPPGALELARTETGVQAMRLGERVWGVQFHPEVDPATVSSWARDDVLADRLTTGAAGALLAGVRAGDAERAHAWSGVAERFAAVVRDGG